MNVTNPLTPGAKVGLTVLLAVYGFVILGSPDSFRIIDNVDLAIHETGHLIFGPSVFPNNFVIVTHFCDNSPLDLTSAFNCSSQFSVTTALSADQGDATSGTSFAAANSGIAARRVGCPRSDKP